MLEHSGISSSLQLWGFDPGTPPEVQLSIQSMFEQEHIRDATLGTLQQMGGMQISVESPGIKIFTVKVHQPGGMGQSEESMQPNSGFGDGLGAADHRERTPADRIRIYWQEREFDQVAVEILRFLAGSVTLPSSVRAATQPLYRRWFLSAS